MLPRFEFIAARPFHEFIGLAQLMKEPLFNRTSVEEKPKPERITAKIDRSPVTGKITGIRVSKSLIRQLIYKGEPYPVCPTKVYHTTLVRDIISPPSEAMLKGLYFESKCLGTSADGSETIDLPRHKRTGARLAEHDRIDQAVERFYKAKDELGLMVEPSLTQVYHRRPWVDPGSQSPIEVFLDGTLDFISPIKTANYSFSSAVIDLKLTKDRDMVESFSNGLFHSTPWGNMEMADYTEAMMYRLIFGKPFVYLVFDYKRNNAGFRDIPIITDIQDPDPQKAAKARQRMAELNNTIRWVVASILQWESEGWQMNPIPKICANCPILDCSKRNLSQEV
jgi:hypothetical protein